MNKQTLLFLSLNSLSAPLWAASATIEPAMVTIPAGQFAMGSDTPGSAASNEHTPASGPRHTVRIKAFKLAQHELTVKQFRQFVEATGHKTNDQCWRIAKNDWGMEAAAGTWNTPTYAPSDYHPVLCVSWEDAKAYVQWLAAQTQKPYRLPSEAEWEYAARAGSDQPYHFGANPGDLCRYANTGDLSSKAALLRDHGIARKTHADCDDRAEYTAVVGMYEPNAYGLHDMIGNVSEWVEDCQHLSYAGAPDDGSAWTSGCDTSRAGMYMRRGSSYHNGPLGSVSSLRGHGGKTNASSLGEGIRIALDMPAELASSCSSTTAPGCASAPSNKPFAEELAKAQAAERKRRGR